MTVSASETAERTSTLRISAVLLRAGFTTSVALLVLVFSFEGAQAQELRTPIALPGSINASFGTAGPIEPDNTIGSATVEQGITVWRRGSVFVVGFLDLTVRADTRGYAWNNTMPYLAGGKLVMSGSRGVFQAAIGAAGDGREPAYRRPILAGHVSYWAGWQRSRSKVQLPGNTWATSGLVAATEPDNWITAAHVEQGVTVWRGRHLSLVPFAGATLTADTQQHPWNNRGFVDTGVKVTTRVHGAAIDIGAAQRVTRSWQRSGTEAAPVVFVNLWVGWMPRMTR